MSVRVQAIASGSNGNCFVIDSPEGAILIDAGISRKRIIEGLQKINVSPSKIKGILVTHRHYDHIFGLPILSNYISAPVYATEATIMELQNLNYRFNHWDQVIEKANKIKIGNNTDVNPFTVTTIEAKHDSKGTTGYRVSYKKSNISISVLTDTGRLLNDKRERIRVDLLVNSDLILLESNYDLKALNESSRPAYLKERIKSFHLSNKDSSFLLSEIYNIQQRHLNNYIAKSSNSKNTLDNRIHQLKAIILGHLSGECNSSDLLRSWVRHWSNSIKNNENFDFYLAPRDSPSDLIEITTNSVKRIRKYAGTVDY